MTIAFRRKMAEVSYAIEMLKLSNLGLLLN